MSTKRRPSTPDVPSPLRRGIGAGGIPVPVIVIDEADAEIDGDGADPFDDEVIAPPVMPPRRIEAPPLEGELDVFTVSEKLEPAMFGAVGYVKRRLEERPPIKVHGRECRQPRNVGFFSNEPIEPYTYSRSSTHEPQPLDINLTHLLRAVNHAVPGAGFNAILVNEYGTEGSIGFHADDESGLGENGSVATLSTGESRSMVFKDRGTKATVAELHLHHGMLVVMRPGFQKKYLHGIPRRKTHVDRCGKRVPNQSVRISFTFRRHKPVGGTAT